MRIPKDVILIWPGTNSSIPSGWTRETALDGKYPKGWGTQNPNSVGGSDSHFHTINSHSHNIDHTHSFTSGAAGSHPCHHGGSGTYDLFSYSSHTHSGTSGTSTVTQTTANSFNSGSASNDPPFKKVIFIKAGLSSILQNNIIAFWTGWQGNNNPPNNWQECNGNNGSPDLRNKYIKGANTNEDAGGEGGSYYNTHTLNHSHTIPSHSHYQTTTTSTSFHYTDYRGNGGAAAHTNHQHTATFGTSNQFTENFSITYNTSEVVEPVYRKVLAIQFKTGAIKEKGIIGLWLGNTSDIPKGWVLCDGNNGTIDLRDKFIKIANNSSEIGQTGGSNTHTHANYSHSHSGYQDHNHTVNLDTTNHGGSIEGAYYGSDNPLPSDTHAQAYTDTVYISYSQSSLVFNSADNQPPYRTVAYIQFQKEIYGGTMLTNFL